MFKLINSDAALLPQFNTPPPPPFVFFLSALTKSSKFPNSSDRVAGLVRRPPSLPASLRAKPDGMPHGELHIMTSPLPPGTQTDQGREAASEKKTTKDA